ncbi:MAG: hypothetical protein RKP20_12225 [Candidatus Competibacter sp.]|nr:hypothetical protein [Candidatus Competibacter sp.]MDS4059033.1 hypothetical protein [Candidatus Contendobacter sp.]
MRMFEVRQSWISIEGGEPEFHHTMAQLEIFVNGCNLTRNENIWSQSVHDSVIVSTYPLALWILQSWWRLLYEPLPPHGTPVNDWRMAHELGAANYGFVWPKIIFVSDSKNIQIWAIPSDGGSQQSVRYLNGLNPPASISIPEFRDSILDFLSTTNNRLNSLRFPHSDLSELLKIILDEQRDEASSTYRKLEAVMGFDPDECPSSTMNYALQLRQNYGEETLMELAPVYGKAALKPIEQFISAEGVFGKPSFTIWHEAKQIKSVLAPWKMAVKDAQRIRKQVGNENGLIKTEVLFDLLGVASEDVRKWEPTNRASVSVGIPMNSHQQIKFVPRKRHPISKRFELSRYIGDYLYAGKNLWLTNTDLGTARQRYQRAFAAEFLCPIDGLIEFLQNDFSDEAIDDAADYFDVSQQMITSLLANNHVIEKIPQDEIPYEIGFR